MSLTVAVQMDPIETVAIGGDSTFALMLSGAGARAPRCGIISAPTSAMRAGGCAPSARPLTVERPNHAAPGGHFHWTGEVTTLDLGRDTDVVLMRQDPPFDMAYITATHLLERCQGETLVVNDPAEVRNAPEKLFVLGFPDLMPPTMVTRSRSPTRRAFRAEHGDIVVKPLYGNAGSAVFHIRRDDANLPALVELFSRRVARTVHGPKVPARRQCRRQAHRAGRRPTRPGRSTGGRRRGKSART